MKYVIPFVIISALAISISSPAYAHDNDRHHNKDKWRYIDREDREK